MTFAFITRCGCFTGGLGGAVREVATVVSVMSEIEANVRILVVKTCKIRSLDLNYANGVFEFDGYRLCVFFERTGRGTQYAERSLPFFFVSYQRISYQLRSCSLRLPGWGGTFERLGNTHFWHHSYRRWQCRKSARNT